MHYKRKRQHSKVRCGICAGQRRRFGAGSCKMRAKLKDMDNIDPDTVSAEETMENGMDSDL